MASLSRERLGITLLRVVPGVEMGAIRDWLAMIDGSQGNGVHRATAFLTLGRSDIALIHRANIEEEPEPELYAGALPNVSCAREFDCYAWQGQFDLQAVMNHPLCAMVFLRFNPDLASEPGFLEVECEQRLAQCLSEHETEADGVQWAMLGAYGRASNVVLVGASEIDALLKATEEIIQTPTKIAAEPSNAMLRETYTIIGMEWPGPGGGIHSLRDRFRLRKGGREYFNRAEVSIELRCCSSDVESLSRRSLGEWTERMSRGCSAGVSRKPRVTIAYGPSDVNVRFPLMAYKHLGTLVADLHEFRAGCSDVLLTSESRIELRQVEPDELEDFASPFLAQRERSPVCVGIDSEEASDIMQSHKGAAGVLHSFYAYNHRLSDDGGEAVRDMFLYYGECAALAKQIAEKWKGKKEPIADDLRWLYVMLEEGQIGQIQRLDPFPMSRRVGTDLGPYRTGIRRRLWAAQAIPLYIFDDLLKVNDSLMDEWRGFLIGGRLKEDFVTRPPVMMIPPESLPHPEHWWVLTHESMHDYVERNRFLELGKEPWVVMKGALSQLFPRAEKQRYFEYLVAECLCDMLEYLSLGAMPWQDHQMVCWAEVLDRLAADPGRPKEERNDFVAEHVLRTVCAIRCSQECQADTSQVILESRFVGEVISRLRREGKDVSGLFEALDIPALREKLIRMCEAFKPATKWLLARNPFLDAKQEERREWVDKSYPSVRETLVKGELVEPGKLSHPDLLVWFLRREWLSKPMPPQMASATTLSLLWFYLSCVKIR